MTLIVAWLGLNVAYVIGACVWAVLRGPDSDLNGPWDPRA